MALKLPTQIKQSGQINAATSAHYPGQKSFFPVKSTFPKKKAPFKRFITAHGTPRAKSFGMIFVNPNHQASEGISGFYGEPVTILRQTRKGLAKTVKYVNNFGQLPACNCSLAP